MTECPDCTAIGRTCPGCAPYVTELTELGAQIDVLRERHAWLEARLDEHRSRRAAEAAAARTDAAARTGEAARRTEEAAPGWPPGPSGEPVADGAPVRPRLSRHAVQNVLLLLGGALLAVAAVVFTVVSWGNPAIRAGILIAATAATLAAAWPLTRRGLDATAETIAYIALALVPLDAIAVANALHGPATGGTGYSVTSIGSAAAWAAGTALIAAGWALYGRLSPLRLPRPTAIAIAQIPFPLAAIAVGPTPAGLALALLATAAFDAALLSVRPWSRRLNRAERDVAALVGLLAGLGGAGTAFVTALLPAPAGGAVRTAGVLVVAVVLGTAVATVAEDRWLVHVGAGVAALAAIGALSAPPVAWLRSRPTRDLPDLVAHQVAAAAYPLATALVLLVVLRLRGRVASLRPGALVAGLGMLGVLGLLAVPGVLLAALHPWSLVFDARLTIGTLDLDWWVPPAEWWSASGGPGTLVTLLVLTGLAAAGATRGGGRRLAVPSVHPAKIRAVSRLAVPVLLAATGLVLPPALALPYAAVLVVHVALTGLLLAARPVRTSWLSSALAGYVAVLTVLWAHAEPVPYVAAMGALVAVFAAAALAARTGSPARIVGTYGAVLAAGLCAVPGWMTSSSLPRTTYLPLVVTAVCLLATFRAPRPEVTRPALIVAFLAPIQAVWPNVQALRTGTTTPGFPPHLAATLALIALLSSIAAWAYARAERRDSSRASAVRPDAEPGAGPGAVPGTEPGTELGAGAGREPEGRTGVGREDVGRAPNGLDPDGRTPDARTPGVRSRPVYAYLAYGLAALAALALGRGFFTAVGGPYLWVAHSWAGAPEAARAAVVPFRMWTAEPLLMPVLVVAALAAVLAAGAHRGRWAAFGVGRVAGPIALTPLPLAADLPYAVAVGFLVALTAVLALWAAVSRSPAGGAALWVGSLAAVWSLAERPATFVVLAAFAVIGTICAVRGRGTPVAATSAAVTALTVGAEGAAAALGSGLPRQYAGMVVLAVAVMTARAAVQLVRRPPGSERAAPDEPPAPAPGRATGHDAGRKAGPNPERGAGPPPERGTGPNPGRVRGWITPGLLAAAGTLWVVAAVMTVPYELLAVVLAVGGATLVSLAQRVGPVQRMNVLAGAWVACAAGVAIYLPVLANTAIGPYHLLAGGWRGLPPAQGVPVVPPGGTGIGMAVVAIVTGAVVASVRMVGGPRRAYAVASVAVPVALTLLPYAARLPYPAIPAITAAVTLALAVQAALDRRSGRVPGLTALWSATLLIAQTIVTKPTLLAALAGLAVLAAAVAWYGRTAPVRAGAAAAATLAGAGLAVAAPLAAGIRPAVTGFVVLAAAGAAAFVAAEARHRRVEIALPVEIAGYAATAAGVALAGTDGRFLAAAFASAALLSAGIAVRPDRRLPALAAAAVLAQLALWTWLLRLHVTAPEAYTITVTLAGLTLAQAVERRWPGGSSARGERGGASSWWTYGPALLITFVPSLVTAWPDPGLTRPLLLAVAALGVTLGGAWSRLQAPLLVGGGVLLVNAAHEVTPAVVELVGGGPRWVPIAVAGVALLFTGATYEHRLRDVRRAYRTITRMR